MRNKSTRIMPHNLEITNEPYECIMLLDSINKAIRAMSLLGDESYVSYIFNQGTTVEAQLKELGITSDCFDEMQTKLETMRSLMYGDNLDWDGLVQYELRNVAAHEHSQVEWLQDALRKAEYKLKEKEGKA